MYMYNDHSLYKNEDFFQYQTLYRLTIKTDIYLTSVVGGGGGGAADGVHRPCTARAREREAI